MLRRHFFLVGALVLLAVVVVLGGLKLVQMKAGGGGGAQMAQGPGGAPGGPAGARRGPGGPGGPGGGAPLVSVAVAKPHVFVDSIEVLGVAKGRQSVTLTAAATQLVDRVRFRDGEAVPRGAVLVELKDAEQDAAVIQARAQVVQAERAYERWRTLADKGFAAKAAVDQYEAAYATAQANLRAAQARQGDRIIRAPFSGVVGLSDIAPGALVNPGSPIVTLDDVSAVRVDFQVPDRYLPSLREGQAISAVSDALPGETIRGRIAKLDTRIDENTRAITARAEFPNGGGRIKPGMMMRVSIARGSRQGVSVPESSVAVQGDAAVVYLIADRGGRSVAEQRPILTGARQEGLVEIREGVAVGDRLVADGLNKITAGQPIRVGGGPQGSAAAPRAGARPTS